MKKIFALAIAAASLSSTVFAAPPAGGSPGTVRFTGEIVAGACGLDAGSADQTVSLGQVPAHSFTKVGDQSTAVPFIIKLTDCDTTTQKQAYFTFTGAGTAGNPDILGTTGAANGVGIRLQSPSHAALKIGQEDAVGTVLANGDNNVQFAAMYEQAGATAVTPGDADAVAQFTIRYN